MHDSYDDVWMKILAQYFRSKMQNPKDFDSILQKFWKSTWLEVEKTEREAWIIAFPLS